MQLVNAAQDGHWNLYHYQPFSGNYVGYLEQTLRDRTIHLSQPSSFNDPWDSKPWFNLSILDDPEERARHVQWLVETANADAASAAELRANPILLRAIIHQVRDGHVRAIDDQYRLYCLTPDPLHQLMWAHYGDNHRGVCLEFDARADQLIGAYRVYYSQDYPIVPVYADEDNANLVPIFTKAHVWEYEREYRLIAEEAEVERLHMPRTVQSNLALARGSLIGVIVGCQCVEEHVVELVERHAPELRVRRANRMEDRYQLTLETIRPGR